MTQTQWCPNPDSYTEPKQESDIDSDPELNDDIQEVIDELKELK